MTYSVELGEVSRTSDGAFDAGELLRRVERDLSRVISRAPFVALAWPVPRVSGERLLGAETEGEAVFWAPPGEDEACGLGAAFLLSARGPERFQSIQSQARDAWSRLDATALDELMPAPRFFGGFAFQPGQAESSLWKDFGDARFVLPKLSYLKNDAGAWLRLIVHGPPWPEAEFRAELERPLQRALHALFAPTAVPAPARELSREERSPEAWAELVRAIQSEISQGHAQKIVAARRLSLNVDRTLLPAAVHARLRADAPESTRFAFRVGAATFLGATPEQLVQKAGLEIATEAVAGSISADDTTAASRLLESDKDIREHEFVVSEILRLLGPMTRDLVP